MQVQTFAGMVFLSKSLKVTALEQGLSKCWLLTPMRTRDPVRGPSTRLNLPLQCICTSFPVPSAHYTHKVSRYTLRMIQATTADLMWKQTEEAHVTHLFFHYFKKNSLEKLKDQFKNKLIIWEPKKWDAGGDLIPVLGFLNIFLIL